MTDLFTLLVTFFFPPARVAAHSPLVKQWHPLRETLSSLSDLDHVEPRLTDDFFRQNAVVLDLISS